MKVKPLRTNEAHKASRNLVRGMVGALVMGLLAGKFPDLHNIEVRVGEPKLSPDA